MSVAACANDGAASTPAVAAAVIFRKSLRSLGPGWLWPGMGFSSVQVEPRRRLAAWAKRGAGHR
jgi:hypothetical protein